MKTALCLSGQPRGLPEGLEQIKRNLIEPNGEVDVFIHCWFDENQVFQPFESAQPPQSGHVGRAHPESVKMLQDLPNVKAMMVEPPREFSIEGCVDHPSAVQGRLQSMFYSAWQANTLKRVHEGYSGKYDVVIKTRTDMWYGAPVVLADFAQHIGKSICVPTVHQHMRHYTNTMTDVFAFGSSEHMDAFCDVYPNYKELYDMVGNPFGEDLLGAQVRVKSRIDVHPVAVEAHILRKMMPETVR